MSAASGAISANSIHLLLSNLPSAAEQFANALIEAAESLVDFPERGRMSGPGRRELATIWPYIIRYRVARDHVLILRVRHGRRRPG